MDLGEAIRVVSERYKLCPNRIWQVSSRLPGWESILPQLLEEFSLRHENHTACTLDYCEFSTRNFTTVKQYHELGTCEKELNAVIRDAHTESGACFPLQGLFQEQRLLKAINSNRLTAWSFDGCSLLQFPQAFMAISHVWSDGTGAGKWSAKGVNRCLYDYFQGIARQFQCEGIWWDTICIPKDRRVRGKAMKAMQLTYEYAKITLVHDRFLRNLPYRSPRLACIAVIMSSWFTRGWTALELVKSRKVKIVFKDCIVDLDEQILYGIDDSFYAAGVLRNFRKNRVIGIENLVTILGSRYTSWAKDQATIAGLLAGNPSAREKDLSRPSLPPGCNYVSGVQLVPYKPPPATTCNWGSRVKD
ncbi:hypothetical protein F4825DRAFT_467294 [Nemania diffusa]|nr:hypothetical protein F4825DRAFT_467294 [Nemania diffusa]